MAKSRRGWPWSAALVASLGWAGLAGAAEKDVDAATCYECHQVVAGLHQGSAHQGVNCAACHSGLAAHGADPKRETRPVTDLSWNACGACHADQLESFLKTSYHRPARDEKSQLTNRSPNPFWDKLMAGHGFAKEHSLTRSHPWMLVDHYLVDRAFGGRFQPKEGWRYVAQPAGKGAWDYVVDKLPDSKEHKAFAPQTAAAANPVCLQCKTQDQILDWAYMGDPGVGAKWDRTSNVIEVARSQQHGLNCFTCHDPHAAKPRIVRDSLIEALTRPEGDTLWHQDPARTKIQVIDMGVRGFTRKIALLEKYDSRLQCGQCHVEYNCNPGTDTKTGERVTMADRRTNHMPFKDAFGLYEHYVNQIAFLDFRNPFTGGLLWKAQHPEAEAFYHSVHAKNGVQCDDCHQPKVKSAKTGKVYTSHFATTPRHMLQETCLKCHGEWDEEKARYTIDSVKAYVRGKMRKAEFWMTELVDAIAAAKAAGLAEATVKQAQDQHLRAHFLWEFWTAENSDGFHNPEMARESLTKAIDEAQKGLKILAEATAKK